MAFVVSLSVAAPERLSCRPLTPAPVRSVTCTASEPWSAPKARTPGVMRLSSVTGLRAPISGHVTTVESFM